jgi:hypothetical protein
MSVQSVGGIETEKSIFEPTGTITANQILPASSEGL